MSGGLGYGAILSGEVALFSIEGGTIFIEALGTISNIEDMVTTIAKTQGYTPDQIKSAINMVNLAISTGRLLDILKKPDDQVLETINTTIDTWEIS